MPAPAPTPEAPAAHDLNDFAESLLASGLKIITPESLEGVTRSYAMDENVPADLELVNNLGLGFDSQNLIYSYCNGCLVRYNTAGEDPGPQLAAVCLEELNKKVYSYIFRNTDDQITALEAMRASLPEAPQIVPPAPPEAVYSASGEPLQIIHFSLTNS